MAACYILSIIMTLMSSNLILFWVMLELSVLMVVSVPVQEKTDLFTPEAKFYYFSTQSIFSMLIVMSMCLSSSSLAQPSGISSYLLGMLIVTKVALFPACNWMFNLSKMIGTKYFAIISTIQKLPTLMILMNMMSWWLYCLMLINMWVGSILMNLKKTIKEIMVSLSMYSCFWYYFLLSEETKLFLLYFSMTNFMIYTVLINTDKQLKKKDNSKKIMMILVLMTLINCPPLGTFAMKMIVLASSPEMTMNPALSIMLGLTTILVIMSFYKISVNLMMMTMVKIPTLYLNKDQIFKGNKMITLALLMLMFLYF